MQTNWAGVFPAITTKFTEDHQLDINALRKHIGWQIDCGVHGIIVTGSLGENAVLAPEEKIEVLRQAVAASAGRVPVLAGLAETTTAAACRMAEQGCAAGADGFMLLPAMQYHADRREALHHLRAVARATDAPLMIYNNPVAYNVDVTPEMLAELADEAKFVAIKESSDNVRRITDIINLVGDRYRIFTGVDNLALESLLLGAVGWVAGLVCAFPRETVALYRLAKAGQVQEAVALYRWFMPLLHLDVSTKLVQNIKLAEAVVGVGSEYVRLPRLPLAGDERARVETIIRAALENRPAID